MNRINLLKVYKQCRSGLLLVSSCEHGFVSLWPVVLLSAYLLWKSSILIPFLFLYKQRHKRQMVFMSHENLRTLRAEETAEPILEAVSHRFLIPNLSCYLPIGDPFSTLTHHWASGWTFTISHSFNDRIRYHLLAMRTYDRLIHIRSFHDYLALIKNSFDVIHDH